MVISDMADLWDQIDIIKKVDDPHRKSGSKQVRCRFCKNEFTCNLVRLKGHLLGARKPDGGTIGAAPCEAMGQADRQRLLDTFGPRLVQHGEYSIAEAVLRHCTAPYVDDPSLLPEWLARSRPVRAPSARSRLPTPQPTESAPPVPSPPRVSGPSSSSVPVGPFPSRPPIATTPGVVRSTSIYDFLRDSPPEAEAVDEIPSTYPPHPDDVPPPRTLRPCSPLIPPLLSQSPLLMCPPQTRPLLPLASLCLLECHGHPPHDALLALPVAVDR